MVRGGARTASRREPGDAPAAVLSLAGHAVALALFVWLMREAAPPPLPPSYAVSLVAAPAGPRAIASAPDPVADAPPAPAAAPSRPAPSTASPSASGTTIAPAPARPPRPMPATRDAAPAPRARESATSAAPSAPRGATRAPTTPATPAATGAPVSGAPRAGGGGPTGDRGNDVVTVRTTGTAFPFPGYLENIVRQIALNFAPRGGGTGFRADVAFTIQRDGTVSDLRLVNRSGNYGFDMECLGAVEAVGSRKGFGPLPNGFRDDALPVVFSFDPRTLR